MASPQSKPAHGQNSNFHSFIAFSLDILAKTLVIKGAQPETDNDDSGETKPSIGIKLDIGKLISDIFGFIKFRKVEDGVKTFSIFTVIIEFVKSILAKF